MSYSGTDLGFEAQPPIEPLAVYRHQVRLPAEKISQLTELVKTRSYPQPRLIPQAQAPVMAQNAPLPSRELLSERLEALHSPREQPMPSLNHIVGA